ncbi:hypothetical protein ATY37_20290 [Vibrio cidicii]|uniref:Uncharacterized protein n=1 Tax=Vibrio cidicii TaxID=1763883 RepID=A0A151KUF8_9VIBR|nr:hypothetical protein [Vibrio cholerae]KYN84610.1 hypothetical protein ATY37_20290 [Vibrio cidicii]OEJ10773.1 hypothetical protein BFX26_18205 [Vibrio cholerae]OFI89567.1 hypothetical protein BFX20_14565 [Vibrio cholerae]OFI94012.1 hypothetical protein BFX22_18485 [Vibrio cholerae]
MKTNLELNTEISKCLDQLEKNYCNSRPQLNKHGVWLFLATLGCWSVPETYYQLAAVFITFYIFTSKAYPRVNGKVFINTFEVYKLWKLHQAEVLSLDERNFWRNTIIHVAFRKYSIFHDIKSCHHYYVAYLFLMATLFNVWSKI